jgi:hypothetical protein
MDDRKHIIPDGLDITTAFKEAANEMIKDIHLAAYAVDPEFWVHDVGSDNDVMSALRRAIVKVYCNQTDCNQKAAKAMEQFQIYKSRMGDFRLEMVQESACTLLASAWWRSYGSAIPELRYFAIRILDEVISSSASERNWKDFKHIRSKIRNRLSLDSTKKQVIVAINLRLKDLQRDDWKLELNKWTEEDELFKLDASLVASSSGCQANEVFLLNTWWYLS